MQVVVSLYTENPNWILDIPDQWDVVVYMKSESLCVAGKLSKRAQVIRLPNIGRESHSFFYHIVKNYHHLHDVSLFLQGNPFDHSLNILEILDQKNIRKISQLVNQKMVSMNYAGICQNVWIEDINEMPKIKKWKLEGCQEIWSQVFSGNMPKNLRNMWGNQFAITRLLVQRFPLSFYQSILKKHYASDKLPWKLEILLPEIYLQADQIKVY